MDIVERLRKQTATWSIFNDAADEIERLREQAHYHYENGLKKDVEIERLREALQHIRSLATTPVRQIRLRSILEECVWFVNAALKEGE